MRVTCPSCASCYDIDPGRIGLAGRTLRCAACRGSWFVEAIVAPAADEASGHPADPTATAVRDGSAGVEADPVSLPVSAGSEAVPAFERIGARPTTIEARRARPKHKGKPARGRPARSRKDRAPPRGLAAALALALLVGVPGTILARRAVVEALPGTATLFAAIGLPVNLLGLSFANVSSSLVAETNGPVLEVEGLVRNDGRHPVASVPLDLTIAGPQGETLYSWSAQGLDATEVAAGAVVPFRVRLASPPSAGRRVEVSFRSRPASRVASR